MIKYLGSKRRLAPLILRVVDGLWEGSSRPCALDLFSGTARVGHALKGAGCRVVANDYNAYARTLAGCYVAADRERVERDAARLIDEMNGLAGRAGWFTEEYAVRSRYLHPENAARIEAVRERIAGLGVGPELEAVLLTSLLEAADRVDSTAGVQMAFLKRWSARATNPLFLRMPNVLRGVAAGRCEAHRMDALDAVEVLAGDIAYLDPPYNHHSYLGNYHVWETLVRWDRPEVYGIARKRVECRERRSAFNSKNGCGPALGRVIERVMAECIIVSFSDEGRVAREEIEGFLAARFGGAPPLTLEVDQPRYVGAKIGIYNRRGERVGKVGRLENRERLYVAAAPARLERLRRRLAEEAAPEVRILGAGATAAA
ncbi:MAG: DNA adenine methylase [Planctomycetota bacterium]|nr:DNA adenine methylase [Planctomycetota bacterium]